MTVDLAQVKTMTEAVLVKGQITSEQIREHIASLRVIAPGMTDAQAEQIAREIEEIHGVTIRIGSVIKEAESFAPWLDEARKRIEPFYWNRYREYLSQSGQPRQVVSMLDQVTDQTLDLLENPDKSGPWDRRGLVMGHVQSGKTTNYIGLMCKAADAGYMVVIVIAGIHNNLRRQTQIRIDEGFIGFDSAQIMSRQKGRKGRVGVGLIDRRRRPSAFTNNVHDFRKTIASSSGIPLTNLKTPAVFVVKKNASTLGNLLEWLTEQNTSAEAGKIPYPMILIDDEADNASINVMRGKAGVSKINGLIRQLLNVFDRSCYVGYTATPFANIFIEPESDDEMVGEDLFPRDFIMSLDPPSNYFGASRVFVDEPDAIIRDNSDNGETLPLKHPKEHLVPDLPWSLRQAVRAFVIARSIRLVRGSESAHNSMLVNVSRFTDVQRQVRGLIHEFVGEIRDATRINGALPLAEALDNPEMSALRSVFDTEYAGCSESWPAVQERLFDSVGPVRVVEINTRSSDALNYAEHKEGGLNVIAVGGFSLSRGLTLEGLVISYFLRNSMMYDTLMQMGRWFGYRTGYDDLCRIWMPEEAAGWYTHVAESIEELREDVRRMQTQGSTPKEFGLRVRSHPDSLTVTARGKMGSGKEFKWRVGLANQFIETWQLDRSEVALTQNREAAQGLARELEVVAAAWRETGRGRLVSDVPAEAVLRFLSSFKNHPASMLTESSAVCRYIKQRVDEQLARWDVLFTSVARRKEEDLIDDSLGFEVCCQRRAPGSSSTPELLHVTSRQRVASRGVERVGLSEEQARKAEEAYRQREPKAKNFPDWIYRRVRERPLLIVHLLAIGGKDDDLRASKPVVAWSISVPHVEGEDKTVEYVVNTTWLRQIYGDQEEEESTGDED